MSYVDFPRWFLRLDHKDQSVVKRHLKRQIPFLSGTMSPAASHEGDLESLEWVLDYYKQAGCNEVVMQPKYMGSRAQLEIRKHGLDDYEVRFISRGGFPILCERMEGLASLEDEWFVKLLTKFPNLNYILVDGELLPWSAMGSGLIEKTFKPVAEGLTSEALKLYQTAFNEILAQKLLEIPEDFPRDLDRNNKKAVKEVVARYGHANYQTWTTLLEYIPFKKEFLKESFERVMLYKTQLDYYSYEATPSFEPFQILKLDDRVLPFDNVEGFWKLSKRPYKVIDLNATKSSDVRKLYDCWQNNPKWFGDCEALEGVVIKPLDPKRYDIMPYVKVRNPEYLRLVYGPVYDHPLDYNILVNRKSIWKKSKLSIKEWELGIKLLQMDASSFSLENEQAMSLFVDFMRSEYQLKSVDPRL